MEITTITTPIDSSKHEGETEIRNASEATCTEDGYTGDTYCKDCGVKIADGEVISATGHTLEKVNAKEATHEAAGNIAYYQCSVCGKLFKDAEAAEEITLEDTVIAKGEHDYGTAYKSDAENHWKECDCGNVVEKEAHKFGDWTVTKEATETAKGSKERVCSVCGYKEIAEIPAIEAPSEPTESTDSEDTKSPTTGDNSNAVLWIVLMFVSASALTTIGIFAKKKHIK